MNTDQPRTETQVKGSEQVPETAPPWEAGTQQFYGTTPDGANERERRPPGAPEWVGLTLGDYELLDKLGEGGMGVVYRARQRSADRIVAIKLIRQEYLTSLSSDTQTETLRRFLTEAQATLDPEHPHILISIGNLAGAYLKAEQAEKAFPLLDELVAGRRKRANPDDPVFASLLAKVSLDLLQYRQYAAAETYLRECLAIREKTLPDDWLLFNTKSMLGGALAGQKKFQEPEPLLVEGYSGLKEREAKIPPNAKDRLREAIGRLVDLYTAWEKPTEAAKWRRALEEAKPKPEEMQPDEKK